MKEAKEIQALTDCELLEYICSCDDEVAYNIFVNRFIKDCQDICGRICAKRKLDSHVGLQIAHDVFEKIRKHKSFKRTQTVNSDERKAIIGFIYRIAINLFNDHYRSSRKAVEFKPTYLDDLTNGISRVNDLHKKREVTAQILKSLNDKERKVLITDIDYKRQQAYLPDDIVERLSTELNIKPASIRKVRERAILKVKKAIDEYNREQ